MGRLCQYSKSEGSSFILNFLATLTISILLFSLYLLSVLDFTKASPPPQP
jgi:hypothetical protein